MIVSKKQAVPIPMASTTAKELLVTADGGGSHGGRVRLWKLELQGLADEIGIPIRVCHFPPGTSKWNKIEHRLFSFIAMNWRGEPLISHEVMLNLIANTKTGLSVRAELDNSAYPKGIKVSDADFASINMVRDTFHGDWNYSIYPRRRYVTVIVLQHLSWQCGRVFRGS